MCHIVRLPLDTKHTETLMNPGSVGKHRCVSWDAARWRGTQRLWGRQRFILCWRRCSVKWQRRVMQRAGMPEQAEFLLASSQTGYKYYNCVNSKKIIVNGNKYLQVWTVLFIPVNKPIMAQIDAWTRLCFSKLVVGHDQSASWALSRTWVVSKTGRYCELVNQTTMDNIYFWLEEEQHWTLEAFLYSYPALVRLCSVVLQCRPSHQ